MTNEEAVRDAIHAWIRDDVGTAVKMTLHPHQCEFLVEKIIAALTAPPASADDVALVDALIDACGIKPQAIAFWGRIDAARTALLARFDAIRKETIEECAAAVSNYYDEIFSNDTGSGYDEGRQDALDIAEQRIRALKGA